MTHSGVAPRWEVRRDQTAPASPYVFAQLSSDGAGKGFPLAVFDRSSFRDGDFSVRIKPAGGSENRGGGLVWRYRDENNYYVVRADAIDQDLVAYKVVNGVFMPLPSVGGAHGRIGVHHPIAANAWTILKVSARGRRFSIYLNHRRVLEVEDGTFPAPGKVGLWTKSDSVTYFNDFRVYPR